MQSVSFGRQHPLQYAVAQDKLVIERRQQVKPDDAQKYPGRKIMILSDRPSDG